MEERAYLARRSFYLEVYAIPPGIYLSLVEDSRYVDGEQGMKP